MIQKPIDILTQFPVRKSKKQKQAFRDALQPYLQGLGYEPFVEKGSMGSKNLIFGDPEKAKYLVTAHYDTCAAMPFPNFITPCNPWVFIAYQLFPVLLLVLIAMGSGILASGVSGVPEVGSAITGIVYWALLLLLIAGPANKHNANDNTSGVVTVLEVAAALPKDKRELVCFVLFDLEESGLLGSSGYAKRHKNAVKDQIVLNLDCVGDGNEIMLFPTKKLRKTGDKMDLLRKLEGTFDKKTVKLHEKGFSVYPSDQANFPYGVGIAAMNRGKRIGLYCSRIHTKRDTVLEEENVNILREQLLALLAD